MADSHFIGASFQEAKIPAFRKMLIPLACFSERFHLQDFFRVDYSKESILLDKVLCYYVGEHAKVG